MEDDSLRSSRKKKLVMDMADPGDDLRVNTGFVTMMVYVACIGGLQYGFVISLFNTLKDPFSHIFSWGDED